LAVPLVVAMEEAEATEETAAAEEVWLAAKARGRFVGRVQEEEGGMSEAGSYGS
jgi:hypothetical protein